MNRSPDRRPLGVPTRDQLLVHAARWVAGTSLVVLAAVLVHRAGHVDQQWQYVAIAAALAPQVALDLLALDDKDRRSRLRASRRPAAVPLVAATVLLASAESALLPLAAATAALVAAAGLLIAAAPLTVVIEPAPRS